MQVSIDETLCTGCSVCVSELPEVFEMGDDGLAKVIVTSPESELADKAKEVVPICPASAIKVEE
ncbi:ferredoxin [bacterium]|nr:ferredoxin [bacterium]